MKNKLILHTKGLVVAVGIIFLWPLQALSFTEKAQWKTAYQATQNLDVALASQLITKFPDSPEMNLGKLYLLNQIDLIEVFMQQNTNTYDSLSDIADERLKDIKGLKNSKQPYYDWVLGEYYIQWATAKIMFGDEFAAFWDIKKAYNHLEKCEREFPNFLPAKKYLGILRVLIGSVPDKYKWMAKLLGFQGGVKMGFKDLNQLLSHEYLDIEAKIAQAFFVSLIQSKREEGYKQMQMLTRKKPENRLVELASIVLASHYKASISLKLLSETDHLLQVYQTPVWYYLKGGALLETGRFVDAIQLFKKYTAEQKSGNYIKSSYYKLFLSSWFADMPQPKAFLDSAVRYGESNIHKDQYALKFAQQATLPHRNITKARVYNDGGELLRAKVVLGQIDTLSLTKSNKIEFLYRKARVSHSLNNTSEAVINYKRVISEQESMKLDKYFAPNSALQLGYIYKDKYRRKDLAKRYFRLALAYKKHEYKQSIDTKAEAALEEMK